MTQASSLRKVTIVALVVGVMLALILVMGGCSSTGDESSDETEEAEEAEETTSAVAFEWTADADCSLCHSTELDSLSDSSCTASSHSSLECTTCHTDTEGLVTAHEDVTMDDTDGAKRLKKTEVSEETCLSCHGSYEELAELTADSTVLTDNNGTVVNPHDLPDVENHESITCTSCHEMHSGVSIEESAMDKCTDCHHSSVFECGTCHS